MAVFFVQTNQPRSDGSGHWAFPFECDFPTIEALTEALNKRGVAGNQVVYRRFSSKRGSPGYIESRKPMMLTEQSVLGIKALAFEIVERPPSMEAPPAFLRAAKR